MKAAVIVVAHPDDEIIWCGGQILRNPDWDWMLVCLCRAEDPSRRPRFRTVCDRLGVCGRIFNLDDSNPLKPIRPGLDIARPIMEAAGQMEWDLVLTHGENGEYGHPRHCQVHQVVFDLVRDGELCTRELWTFAYDCNANTGRCRPRDDAGVRSPLTGRQLAEKKRIVREVYGYAADSFELRACISPEAFHRTAIRATGASP